MDNQRLKLFMHFFVYEFILKKLIEFFSSFIIKEVIILICTIVMKGNFI